MPLNLFYTMVQKSQKWPKTPVWSKMVYTRGAHTSCEALWCFDLTSVGLRIPMPPRRDGSFNLTQLCSDPTHLGNDGLPNSLTAFQIWLYLRGRMFSTRF